MGEMTNDKWARGECQIAANLTGGSIEEARGVRCPSLDFGTRMEVDGSGLAQAGKGENGDFGTE